jgi:hypothetical protein
MFFTLVRNIVIVKGISGKKSRGHVSISMSTEKLGLARHKEKKELLELFICLYLF